MSQSDQSQLTPEQAADVVRYYHDGENRYARDRGWKDKVPLGLAALHAAQPEHSILPDNRPLLTYAEMGQGVEYIEQQSKAGEQPDITPEQQTAIDHIVDTQGCSYEEARRQVVG